MKYGVMSLLMMSVVVTGCGSADFKSQAVDENTNIEQARVQQTKSVKPSRCGMSPPVPNKQKIQAMLIKSGIIDSDASKEQKAQQVQQYIINKRLAFAKKCRQG